jgi:hypothetical protein
MDLTGIIQKFSTPLERKQDDGVFSRVSTSSTSTLQHKLCRGGVCYRYFDFRSALASSNVNNDNGFIY